MSKIVLKSIFIIIIILNASHLYSEDFNEAFPEIVKLEVPFVEQKYCGMCGPACISMIFQYYRATKADQISIANMILQSFPNEPRVLRSGILDTSPIDFSKYPGTGTKMMREFLKKYGDTENIRIKELSKDVKSAKRKESEFLLKVLKNVDSGTPVIVHQYWKGPNSRGHYRIVTGFDLENDIIFLNDPRIGRITQTISEFLSKWNFNEEWLHYNAMIFNPSHSTVNFN